MGHQMDYLLNLQNDQEIINLYDELLRSRQMVDELSGYAKKDVQEFIAESWTEYNNNPNPRKIATRIGKLIDAKYEQKFPRS